MPDLRRAMTANTIWLTMLALATVPTLARAAPSPSRVVDRLSFLHVASAPGRGGLAQIRDSAGRAVLLRGVNVNGLEDYYSDSATPTAVAYPVSPTAYAHGRCPAHNPTVESTAVCKFDAAQIRGFGYDVVRLAVSWSLLEPQPGVIDQSYVDRIAQVVGWLRAQGIYSVIDLHQDAWSKYLYTQPGQSCPAPLSPVTGAHEADGAPAWASPHLTPVCHLAAREVDPAVQEDFQRFWSDAPAPDGVGLQEHFARVVLALARRFAHDPAVAGYDLFNEPSPGFLAPPAMDAAEVFPFYAKVIQTVRAGVPGFEQLFFLEPDVTRDVTDQRYGFAPWSTYSSYPNVVYAPHVYTKVFTPDAEANAPSLGPLFPVSGGYASAAADARSLGVPLWDGEFGTNVATDPTTLRQHYENQDALAVGGALWVWKAGPSSPGEGFSVMHGPYGPGTPFPSRIKYSDRAYPIYTAGTVLSLSYDPNSASFDLRATSSSKVPAGNRGRATLVYVPARSHGPIAATGARLSVVSLDHGAREAYVYPLGGAYRVFIAAAPGDSQPTRPASRGCPHATGRLAGATLGLVRLGMTRARARRAYKHSSTRGRRFMDFFCLTSSGIRVGYPSAALLRTLTRAERRRLEGRVILALTASPHYALRGVRPGTQLARVARRLRIGAAYRIGANTWYLPPNGTSRGVLKVRHGIIEEIGIANKLLTRRHRSARRFLASFG